MAFPQRVQFLLEPGVKLFVIVSTGLDNLFQVLLLHILRHVFRVNPGGHAEIDHMAEHFGIGVLVRKRL